MERPYCRFLPKNHKVNRQSAAESIILASQSRTVPISLALNRQLSLFRKSVKTDTARHR